MLARGDDKPWQTWSLWWKIIWFIRSRFQHFSSENWWRFISHLFPQRCQPHRCAVRLGLRAGQRGDAGERKHRHARQRLPRRRGCCQTIGQATVLPGGIQAMWRCPTPGQKVSVWVLYRQENAILLFLRPTILFFCFSCSNEFSQLVASEYLSFFDFTGLSLDRALRWEHYHTNTFL